jgi:hypothetical protein
MKKSGLMLTQLTQHNGIANHAPRKPCAMLNTKVHNSSFIKQAK